MEVRAIKTNILLAGQDLAAFIDRYCRRLKEGSILAVTSKIVALSEGRVAVKKDSETKQALIKAESDFVLRTRRTYLTIKDDMVMANAGLDESNADGRIILLPRDSFRTAASLRRHLMAKHRLNRLGLIITDSRSLPLRAGITGMAIGYAGFRGLKSYRGQPDIFGRPFKFSRVNIADSLATAAVLCMGEGDERRPLAVISDAPIEYLEKINKNELKIAPTEDMYGPLFKKIL